jgi:hypothetical protein
MTIGQIIITVVLGILTNLITAGLLAILKWQLKRMALTGDFPGLWARCRRWFYGHLEGVVVAGIVADLLLLGFVLIQFPTVTVWTVLVIVFCVAVMAFQLAIYIVIKVVQGILDWTLKKLREPEKLVSDLPKTS